MQIIEKNDPNGTMYLELNGAPPKSSVEIRWQNTLSGSTYVNVVDTDELGVGSMSPPYTYGPGFVPKARLLSDKTGTLVSFSFQDGAFMAEPSPLPAPISAPSAKG